MDSAAATSFSPAAAAMEDGILEAFLSLSPASSSSCLSQLQTQNPNPNPFLQIQSHPTSFFSSFLPHHQHPEQGPNLSPPLWAPQRPPSTLLAALSRQKPSIEERLGGVPVYALAINDKEFVLVSGARTGRSLGLAHLFSPFSAPQKDPLSPQNAKALPPKFLGLLLSGGRRPAASCGAVVGKLLLLLPFLLHL